MLTTLDSSVGYIIEDEFLSYRDTVLANFHNASSFPRGAVMTRGGEPLDKVFFLLDGMVKIYTCNSNGYVRILGYHRKNTIFAMDGLCGGASAVVTTQCVTPVKAIPLSCSDVSRLCGMSSLFALDLAKYYCKVLRLMCVDAENQSICSARERMMNFLSLYMKHLSPGSEAAVYMSQDELASAINCSKVQAARVCAELQHDGIIKTGHRKILITCPDALAGKKES